MRPTRPRSVTVVGWFAIGLSCFTMFLLTVAMSPQLRQTLDDVKDKSTLAYVRLCAGPLIAVLCGVCILQGLNWSRWVLLLWFGSNWVSQLFTTDFKGIPQLLFNGALIALGGLCLFHAKANAFFKPRLEPQQDAEPPMPGAPPPLSASAGESKQ